MNENNNLGFGEFKSQYPKYFEIVDKLANHYFMQENLETIYLSIDEDELNELFKSSRESNTGLEYLTKNCMELLNISNSSGNFYKNLINLFNSWKEEESDDPCPVIPFVSLFITVATKMGEDDDIDWRNYYVPLYDSMNLSTFGISRQKSMKYFTNTFSNSADDPSHLFKEVSDWINKSYPKATNTFIPSDNRKHQSWILNQALINSKDLNLLSTFFKYTRMHPGIDYDKNQIFLEFQKFLNTHPIKAKSFSKGLRSYIGVDEFKEKITEILKQKFTDWDGKELTIDGFKRIELLHKLQFDFNSKNISKISAEFDVDAIEEFNLDEFSIVSPTGDVTIEVWKDETSSKCYIDKIEDIYFDSFTWKILEETKKVKVATYDKKIMVFEYLSSERVTLQSQSWREVSSNQPLDHREVYTVVCDISEIDTLKNYLKNNASYREDNIVEYSLVDNTKKVGVFRDVKLFSNREKATESEHLSIFNIIEKDSSRLEITGGLKIDNRNYLANELPSLLIPQEYIGDENQISLSINDKTETFYIDSDNPRLEPTQYLKNHIKKNSDAVYMNTVKIVFNSKDEFYDIIQYNIITPQSINSLSASTLAYNLNIDYEANILWESHYPTLLVGESRNTGYISGGHIRLPDNINPPHKNEHEFSINDDRLIFIGRKSIDFYEIEVEKKENTWLSNFEKSKKLYLIHPIDEMHSDNFEITPENYQPFRFLKKDIHINDISWKVVFNDSLMFNKIKIFQLGKKAPKRFNEINSDNISLQTSWAESLVSINKLIENEEVTVISEFDHELWKKYVEKANEILND